MKVSSISPALASVCKIELVRMIECYRILDRGELFSVAVQPDRVGVPAIRLIVPAGVGCGPLKVSKFLHSVFPLFSQPISLFEEIFRKFAPYRQIVSTGLL